MKDPVISVKDLFAECVRRATFLIILAIVFAVALCGYKYVRDTNAQKALEEGKISGTQVSEIELTEEEKEQVDEYVKAVVVEEGISDYLKDSIYLNLNPYDVSFAKMEYNVTAATEQARNDAVLAIYSYIMRGELVEDMQESNPEIDEKYYQELIKCNAMDYESYTGSGIITVRVYAADEAQAELFADMVNNNIKSYSQSLNGQGIPHSISSLSNIISSEIVTGIIYSQNEQKNLLTTAQDNVKSLEGALNANQLKAAHDILTIESEETDVVLGKVSLNKKFLILGAALGVILGVMLIAVRYIFTNTIKTFSDVQDMYGITNFGRITCKKIGIWEKLANKIFYSKYTFHAEIEKQMIVSKLVLYCGTHSIKDVILSATATEGEETQLKDVAKALEDRGITCNVINKPLENADTVKAFENVNNAIMVEKIQKSGYEAIESELLFYKSQNINVLGYITII